ncbi:MAG: YegP family protein [Saprospiraceae bacterium]|nr:YegP family protein [Saprospiraceae bacterium]
MPFATGELIRGGKTMLAEVKKDRADDRVDDDYLAVKEYAGHAVLEDEVMTSFAKFTHDNGQHYFVWYDNNGDVLMRSEGYPTTSARDNGLASVQKIKIWTSVMPL